MTTGESKRKRVPGDSPITVGGGGGLGDERENRAVYVGIGFDHNDYVPDLDNRELYQNEEVQLWKFLIGATEYPVNGNSVTITCLNPNTNKTAQIVITKLPIGISFNPKDFPYDHHTGKHTSDKSKKPRSIIKVEDETKTLYDSPNGGLIEITALNT